MTGIAMRVGTAVLQNPDDFSCVYASCTCNWHFAECQGLDVKLFGDRNWLATSTGLLAQKICLGHYFCLLGTG